MVGLDFVWGIYQNSGPALQVVIILGLAYVWKHDVEPRLDDMEQTQEQRADRWDDQRLNSQERALLIDDNADRIDQVEEAMTRLKKRLRGIEQSYAVDHGKAPNGYAADSDQDTGFSDDVTDGGDD